MDLLNDIFTQADLRRRILNQRLIVEGLILRFPCDRSIGFHVVTRGEMYLYVEGQKQMIAIRKGDLVVMSRGQNHYLSASPKLTNKDLRTAISLDEADRKPKGEVVATLVSGAYQLWNEPIHPLFSELPEVFILKNEELDSFDQIQSALNMLALETSKPQIGTEGIVQNLLDIIFAYLIRKIVEVHSHKSKTWSHAVSNEAVKKAIELLHQDVQKNWTLDLLAKEVGLSRAGLAQKFKKHLGDTPLHYLTLIRMQKARALLSNTDSNIEKVAEAVGYGDAFSFSKVFKRITGIPPRDFRTKDQSDKALAYRF
ncbi:MAG: AraC family transcriptional regulator [Bdellovibrionaceae bacterium]|nr:AraC family transcriptional regulator [Pseudobdellovibrionaceae bacterium]